MRLFSESIFLVVIFLVLLVLIPIISAENNSGEIANLADNVEYISDVIEAYYVLDDYVISENELNLTNQTSTNESSINESSVLTPLVGEVTQLNDGYYILLGDDSKPENYAVDISPIERTQALSTEDLVLRQDVMVTNHALADEQFTINLWDYVDEILMGAKEVRIYFGGELLSEQPIFFANLNENESLTYEIEYVFSPIDISIYCEEQTLRDILPPGALVTSSALPLDTIIQQTCTLSVDHKGIFEYADLVVPIDLNGQKVTTVYHIEGDQRLSVENNKLILTGVKEEE